MFRECTHPGEMHTKYAEESFKSLEAFQKRIKEIRAWNHPGASQPMSWRIFFRDSCIGDHWFLVDSSPEMLIGFLTNTK